jgi:hypothetical protein
MSDNGQPLVEAAAALLEGAGGSLPITSLNKALFYLDLHFLLEAGRTVTNATYLALPAGPVVAKYERRIIRALEEAEIAQQDEADDGVTKPVCLTSLPKASVLNARQWDVAHRLGAWAGKRTPGWLSDFSHQNMGWRLAWDRGLGAKRPAEKIDLRIAVQQLVDDDGWLEKAPDGETMDAFHAADHEDGTDW